MSHLHAEHNLLSTPVGLSVFKEQSVGDHLFILFVALCVFWTQLTDMIAHIRLRGTITDQEQGHFGKGYKGRSCRQLEH